MSWYKKPSAPWQKEREQRSRKVWVPKPPKPPKANVVEEKPARCYDPAVALEAALVDVEELLGEKLDSTRQLLAQSEQSSMQAVNLASSALELLSKKTTFCKNEQDRHRMLRAKQSARELLMWRNFGLKVGLHNKPDPANFETYNELLQSELKQTWSKIEQKLMQELIAGDSWAKLARKLRFSLDSQEFSPEMHALLTRIVNTCEVVYKQKPTKSPAEEMSQEDSALFAEMAAEDQFGKDVITALKALPNIRMPCGLYAGLLHDQAALLPQAMMPPATPEMAAGFPFGNDSIKALQSSCLPDEGALYAGHDQAAGPAWLQQMLGEQLAAPLPQAMMPPSTPEMAAEFPFGNDLNKALQNGCLPDEGALYAGHDQAAGPAWLQQMWGEQLAAPLPQAMMPPSAPPPFVPQTRVNPWAEPWPWNSNASSSSGAQ